MFSVTSRSIDFMNVAVVVSDVAVSVRVCCLPFIKLLYLNAAIAVSLQRLRSQIPHVMP